MAFQLAFSPCPNDTFIFAGIVQQQVDLEGLTFDIRLADVETLNRLALKGEADVIKVSFAAWMRVRDRYTVLESGAALGFGSGPLLISRRPLSREEVIGGKIALPGEHTTANRLFSLAFPNASGKEFMVFSAIEEAVLSGKVDAGVIIHENRFTYAGKGLVKVMDLGKFWEELRGLPIPLGGIMVRNTLGTEMIAVINRVLRRSVQYAFDHPETVLPFVRQHAQEMDEVVMKKHIELYVNRFTLDLGEEGHRAIEAFANG